MKIRHLLLGFAVVALMASCGSKTNNETVSDTVETVVEEVAQEAETVVEEVAEAVKEETPAPAAKKQNTQSQATAKQQSKPAQPAVDPCEAKVKAFEKYVDELKAAKKNKANGAEALKAYVDLKKKAESMENTIKDCTSNPDYKTRLTNAILAEKQAR